MEQTPACFGNCSANCPIQSEMQDSFVSNCSLYIFSGLQAFHTIIPLRTFLKPLPRASYLSYAQEQVPSLCFQQKSSTPANRSAPTSCHFKTHWLNTIRNSLTSLVSLHRLGGSEPDFSTAPCHQQLGTRLPRPAVAPPLGGGMQ